MSDNAELFTAPKMLQTYIDQLEADRARLDFMLSDGGQIEEDADHGVRYRFWANPPKEGVGPWAKDGREAIDKAMQPLPPCEEA